MNLKALLEPVGTFAWWRSMFAIVLGCLIMAVGYSYFVSPYNIVPGGVYGMGIVLHNVFPSIQVGTFGYMIDVPLLASAIIVFGRQFGGRTLFAACLTPGLINLLSWIAFPNQEALEALVEKWRATLPDAEIIPISAREGFNIAGLFDRILALLPEGEPFYPKDTLTDKTLRFFASEIIREKILRNYDKEIPYSCEIEIEEYREEPGIDRISAVIYVARNSQKGILIGHKGEKLKKVGRQAREELEEFLRKKVFLQLFVKVSEDWRNDQRQLRRFGYDPQ